MLLISLGHRVLALAVALTVAALATPALAQSTGLVKGKVVDGANQPVEAAKIRH